jgi:hypothetical protein
MLYTRTDTDLIEDPPRHRSLLVHGLRLTLRRFPALLWAFVFNLFYAAITTVRIAGSIGAVTNTSLAAKSLNHGFDLGTIGFLATKLTEGTGLSPSFGTPVILYLATYFLLVPGTLLCYQTDTPARLSTLLQAGLLHFWRFVRILILSLIVMGVILGLLAVIYSKYSDYLDEHVVGRPGFLLNLAGILVFALVAAVLRLYFDLVEVYTVQLGLQLLSNGKPDRRVRKTLLPALRALRHNFLRAYETFILLAAFGLAAIIGTSYIAMHTLAQPRSWPIFVLTQAGLFLMLLTRFWQRGAETTLSLNHPILEEKPLPRASFNPPPPPVYDPPLPPGDLIPAPKPVEPPLGESHPLVTDKPSSQD